MPSAEFWAGALVCKRIYIRTGGGFQAYFVGQSGVQAHRMMIEQKIGVKIRPKSVKPSVPRRPARRDA
jgi:hypothetical protein